MMTISTLVAVSAFVVGALVVASSLFIIVMTRRKRSEKFSTSAAPAVSSTLSRCISNNDTLPAFIRPLDSVNVVRGDDAESRRAYHYDPRVETWERDVDAARRTFSLNGASPRIRIDASSHIKIDESQFSEATLQSIGDGILDILDAKHTHKTGLIKLTGAWRPLQPDCFDAVVVTFVHCAIAEGKRFGMCTSGSAIVVNSTSQVTFINLQSAGVATEADLYMLHDDPMATSTQ